MQENTKEYKDKSQNKKNRKTKMGQDVAKTNIFNSKNLNITIKNKTYIQKKRKRSLSNKKASPLHKMQSLHDSISYKEILEKNESNILEENVLSGINWKKVKALIPTKTTAEVKSFAKKFFYKMKSCKDDDLGIDFTSNSINNLKDMLYQIQSKYPNIIDVISILKKLSDKNVKIRKFKKIKKKNTKNKEKNELNKLEEKKNNYIKNNLFSNLNSDLNYFLKNELNPQNIDGVNNNQFNQPNDDKSIVVGVNIAVNNFANYNYNNLQNVLINKILKCNIENLLLSEYISDLNSKLLNYYLQFNFYKDIYINYLYKINNLLLLKAQNLNSISSIFNIFIYNLLKELSTINHIPLKSNNSSLQNNNANKQNNFVNLNNYTSQLNKNNNN